jgi:hypothetical protein
MSRANQVHRARFQRKPPPGATRAAAEMSGATIQAVQADKHDLGSIHRVAETFVNAKTRAGFATPSPIAGQSNKPSACEAKAKAFMRLR